jgi:hypothetical protein
LAISSASEARHVFECLGGGLAWRSLKGGKKNKNHSIFRDREVAHFYFATPYIIRKSSLAFKRIPHHRK